ncbi:two-component sensor histidine kinase [Flavobacterium magnum]|uniref:histidine kinase n=1 Tax=Flavobacterium magnum TaxID=2162713 RepID=A0A2S0RFP9_9FLAO|nr:ATP-binding protein [Flavobacterium magnum]AWA30068.1 two-component sensor histidine kinase [Flavobacterium magnum]
MKKDISIPDGPTPEDDPGDSQAALLIANQQLALQNRERAHQAAALAMANKELAFQSREKGKRAAELAIANKALAFENKEKELRAAELIILNAELTFQNQEKEARTAELIQANKELAFQVKEKRKRAAELLSANKKLAVRNYENEQLAEALTKANIALVSQHKEKELRAAELLIINKELESFNFITSHDLQEPLRKIQAFSTRILTEEYEQLSTKGRYYFERSRSSAQHMQNLINDLSAYARTSVQDRKFEKTNLGKIVSDVMDSLKERLQQTHAVIEMGRLCDVNVIPMQFRQLLRNLISNSVKFSMPDIPPHITIDCVYVPAEKRDPADFPLAVDHHRISVADNGIGFHPDYSSRIFDIFQRLHPKDSYDGTGIGLTIVKKIVENHHGVVTAKGTEGGGSTFIICIPARQE